MKGRSHRPPPEPSDDWATDGSWTVACSCGVTFDDGEEMVSCDECGVWVHTRCARFARGAPSFSCHTCTARRDTTSNETEVAQLLADLPSNLPPLPLRRPHPPLHDRVHVHGLPAADPALFPPSPIFSPHLWKCAGYVPKKFTFHYPDFPFPDNDNDNDSESPADVLFSLSKEPEPKNRISMLGANWGKRKKDEFREHRKKRPRDGSADKKRESGSVDGKCLDESFREDGMGKAGSKPKNIFVIKASRGRLRDEVTRKRSSLATLVGVEEAGHREPLDAKGEGSDTVGGPTENELALLLHQELNSSPRVPRVPRVRQAVGMQLATQTATSMLKRSSSSVVKDQVSISKRKSKEDTSRENSRNSRDPLDENKRMHVISSSSDQKPQGPTFITDGSAKKDTWNRSLDATTRGEKVIPVGAVEVTIGSPTSFEANGQKGLSVRSSPREVPNDVGALTSRTLPGLIGDILSHGRHMTYEEICEAVRPHWRKMRKLNGERYAYSSHSLAVLDCLRNRNEWSHLVDRGPKTNTSKRKRKPDSDSPIVESENEEAGNSSWREAEDKRLDSHHEDFPKGKRKARKRRRLELKGKGVKEALRSRNQDTVADADAAAFSHSSNDVTEGNFSEDDSQGPGRPGAGDGVSSSSSDDTD